MRTVTPTSGPALSGATGLPCAGHHETLVLGVLPISTVLLSNETVSIALFPIQMMMRYAHLAPSHVAQAVEKLVPSAAPSATSTATRAEAKPEAKAVAVQ